MSPGRTLEPEGGALGGRSRLLRYQWVAKTCQAIRCISNAKGPFRKSAQGVACPLDFSREKAAAQLPLASQAVRLRPALMTVGYSPLRAAGLW
jgi:hypothetical protein